MADPKIRVLVVDDSILFRNVLIKSLNQDPYIEIAGYAVDSYDAFEKIDSLRPDVITLDVEMPKMNGIEFLKKLMPVNPYPVVSRERDADKCSRRTRSRSGRLRQKGP